VRPPVLRPQPVGDVEAGQDLDARRDRQAQGAGHRRAGAHDAVDAHPHRPPVLAGLDVEVARAVGDGVGEQVVDHLHRGGRLGAGAGGRRARRPAPTPATRRGAGRMRG
jgi:hypothetical protein